MISALALRLFFGGALKRLWGIVSHASFAQILVGALAIFALVQHFELVRAHHEAAKWHKQFTDEHSGRIADRQAYMTAQEQAAALNKAHVATENRLREQINETSRDSFIADRNRLRAEAGAAKGSAGATGVPGIPKAVPGTPPEVVSLPPAELLRAQELELQLNALIDWVLAQTSVKPN